ncbi:MAG: hypothetical protein C4551_02630 [Bacillota bacterium]|nr:MAG: hypothetical protein C4551_02630 [Bacillota bacterium]
MELSIGEILIRVGAVGAVYFLTTMILALAHDERDATTRAVGLALSLILMMVATFLRPSPHDRPTDTPPLRYPPRVPGLHRVEDLGRLAPADWDLGRLAPADWARPGLEDNASCWQNSPVIHASPGQEGDGLRGLTPPPQDHCAGPPCGSRAGGEPGRV